MLFLVSIQCSNYSTDQLSKKKKNWSIRLKLIERRFSFALWKNLLSIRGGDTSALVAHQKRNAVPNCTYFSMT